MKMGKDAFLTALVAMAGLCTTSVAHQQPDIGTKRALLEGTSEPTKPPPLGGGGAGGVCPQDTNGDGSINCLDLIDLLLCFGQPAVPPCVEQDITMDGAVNVLDLIQLLLAFGQECMDNNLCTDARPILNDPDNEPPGPTPWTTVGATTDGPPADPLFCITQGGGPHEDVWFDHTTTVTGMLTVTTCADLGAGADIDTVIVVYDGCDSGPGPSALPACANLVQLGCNDDSTNNPCGGAPTFHSTLTVAVVAGNCYKIQLGGFSAGDEGSGTISLTKIELTKDICAGAQPITLAAPPQPQTIKLINTTVGAGPDGDAPDCNDVVTGRPVGTDTPGVWFSVIGDGTTLTATTCNPETPGGDVLDSAISVYCGPCSDLFCVGANLDDANCPIAANASTVTWCSAPGPEFLILVHGQNAADGGTFGLEVSSDGILCPDPVACAAPPVCDLEGAPGATCFAENNANASNMTFFQTAEDFTPVGDSTVTSGCVWLVTLDEGTIHDLRVKYYFNDTVNNIPDDGQPKPLDTPPIAEFSFSDGTLTQIGPSLTGTDVVGFTVQELKFIHAGVALAGDNCFWVEITDTTPTSGAFWEWASGGNARFAQDGDPVDGYDPTDVVTGRDLRFCLDIVFDQSACAGP